MSDPMEQNESKNEPGTLLDLFADYLVQNNLLKYEQAEHASDKARSLNEPLAVYLHKKNLLKPGRLAEAAANYFSMPLYDISAHDVHQIPEEYYDLDLVKKYYGLPILKTDDRLMIAVVDPNVPQLQELDFMSGLQSEYVIVDPEQLRNTIAFLKGEEEETANESFNEFINEDFSDLDELEVDSYDQESESEAVSALEIDERPVVRFVNKILLNAIQTKCSDIHFEPYEKLYRVRYRQDGILHEVANPPLRLSNAIVARLKVMANLDISERRVPQDGRFKLTLPTGEGIDFRINTCPTLYGEKIVMRILNGSHGDLSVDNLGMNDVQKQHYLNATRQSQGMILVTGPTGSGKTISLYTALGLLNTTDKNISSIEDPVEIYLQGVNQVQVNKKNGMLFSTALRAFLRQDPDIIMVGEIRDLETAEIAVKAAQTGHLVLSTLHTNSAPVTITRLVNMGVQAFNIASSVKLVVAQRLVRKLCESCKRPACAMPQELILSGFEEDSIDGLELFEPVGCDRCHQGFSGRLGIFEVMPISRDMETIIMDGGNSIELENQAKKEGIMNLREAGLEKVRLGVTSLSEVNRVVAM